MTRNAIMAAALGAAASVMPPSAIEDAGAKESCVDPTRIGGSAIGREVGAANRLRKLPDDLDEVLAAGQSLFAAAWTPQEGGGRPLTNGVGAPLADPSDPLVFPRNFNRVSAPDANSCLGCHNLPAAGGGGDHVTNVFVTAQRFDFATFDERDDAVTLRGSVGENGEFVTLATIGNSRATLGMFGAGYIELLAREMTRDLQRIRDDLAPGHSAPLVSKGVRFGVLARTMDGWDTSQVEGLPPPSITAGPGSPPNLIVRPFHQAGAVVSLRQFTNNAFNHHHGIQAAERFGRRADPDGDGFCNEMSEAEVTAVSLWQATLPVPGRVVPRDREVEDAVLLGEDLFEAIGCASCHKPELPLDDAVFTEPNPYNPDGNLTGPPVFEVDLTSRKLPRPRLPRSGGQVIVPAYTDLKLHDITSGTDDANCEPIDQNGGDIEGFFAGNCAFLTKKLWGAANEPPFFHHGKFTTLREAVLGHAGEARESRMNFAMLSRCEQDAVIEFLKSLQVLPPGTKGLIVDETSAERRWPPARAADRAAGACPVTMMAGD